VAGKKIVEGLILFIVALGALAAFSAGVILLVLYFRSGRESSARRRQPVRYGNLLQCPNCGYMNPADSPACLNCRHPFPRSRFAPPPMSSPSYPTIPPTTYPPPAPSQPYAPSAAVPSPVQRPPTPGPVAAVPTQPPPVVQVSPVGEAPAVSAADKPSGAWLEGMTGAVAGQRIMLPQADTLVGRSTTCNVQIYDPKASRKHFMIRYGNGAFFIQDQDSSRGTYINGERIMAQKLNDGDRIELGDTSLIFHAG
jgi:hypothetical protein